MTHVFCSSGENVRLSCNNARSGWRCQVKQRNQVKTSVTYTVKYSGKLLIFTINDQSFKYDCSL